jgi:hypothetical protein
MNKLLVLVVMATLASSAQASFIRSHVLLNRCAEIIKPVEEGNASKKIACISYLQGIIDMNEGLKLIQQAPETRLFCPPKTLSGRAAADIFLSYMTDHVENNPGTKALMKHVNASLIVVDALKRRYPCK